MNMRTKFEVRSFRPTCSWDNTGVSKKFGQSLETSPAAARRLQSACNRENSR